MCGVRCAVGGVRCAACGVRRAWCAARVEMGTCLCCEASHLDSTPPPPPTPQSRTSTLLPQSRTLVPSPAGPPPTQTSVARQMSGHLKRASAIRRVETRSHTTVQNYGFGIHALKLQAVHSTRLCSRCLASLCRARHFARVHGFLRACYIVNSVGRGREHCDPHPCPLRGWPGLGHVAATEMNITDGAAQQQASVSLILIAASSHPSAHPTHQHAPIRNLRATNQPTLAARSPATTPGLMPHFQVEAKRPWDASSPQPGNSNTKRRRTTVTPDEETLPPATHHGGLHVVLRDAAGSTRRLDFENRAAAATLRGSDIRHQVRRR